MRYQEALLNCIISGVVYQESMDVLKTTNYYQREVKSLMNKLEPHMCKFLDKTVDMCFHDHLAFFNMQDEFKRLIVFLGNLAPFQLSIMSDVAGLIEQRGDWVMEQLGLIEVKSEELDIWNKRQEQVNRVIQLDEKQLKKLSWYLSKFKVADSEKRVEKNDGVIEQQPSSSQMAINY